MGIFFVLAGMFYTLYMVEVAITLTFYAKTGRKVEIRNSFLLIATLLAAIPFIIALF